MYEVLAIRVNTSKATYTFTSVSIAQATGLEYIVMGNKILIYTNVLTLTCKWLNIQLFDLYQIITESKRITPTTATLIDHALLLESFVSDLSISDHLPVCVTHRVSGKISKKIILVLLIVHLNSLTKTFSCKNWQQIFKTFIF